MNIFNSIENENFEEVKKLVENGVNIYKTRNFPFESKELLSPEMRNKYNHNGCSLLESELELPLTHTIVFCESDEIANYLLDIYERDLEVLNGTNFKKALVAMPEDQSVEFLNCCTFETPSDEKYFEPVLLKKNNLEPPKLAFLSRKLKDKNDKTLKFIRKLEKNGLCDLSGKFELFLSTFKFNTVARLLTSKFISDDEKFNLEGQFLDRFFFNGDISSYEHLYKDYKFNQRHIVCCAFRKNVPLLKFVLKHKMETDNCSMNDILNLEFNDIYIDVHNNQSKVLHEFILNGLLEELNLEFDEEMFYSENNAATNGFFKSWFKSTAKNDEKVKIFFEKHPKILTLKSYEDLTVLEYAVKYGNPDIIRVIYKMLDVRNIFIKNEIVALECLKVSNLFEAEAEKVTEILKLLLCDKFESFVLKYGSAIIENHTGLLKIHAAAYFYSLPFFKVAYTDKFNIFEITNLTFYDECEPFEKLVKNFDILDWNIADSNGETLFMKACNIFRFDPEFLKLIVVKQPDCVHKRTENNSTCLHFVSHHEKDEIARLLVKMGVDSQALNDDNIKAVHCAYSDEVFVYLLQFESDESCQELLCSINKPEHMKLLLSRNIDILKQNHEGIPSILSLIPNGLEAVIGLNYIEENNINVDVNMKDNDGNNMLMRSLLPRQYYPLFRKILKMYKNEIDFKATNNSGHNFVELIKNISFYFDFPTYIEIVKEECAAEFTENFHTFDNFSILQIQPEYILLVIELVEPSILLDNIITFIDDEKVFWKILTKHPTVTDFLSENVSRLFDLIKNCNNEKSIGMLINKLNPEVFNKVSEDENILHAICKKNKQRIIEDFLVFLTVDQVENFSKQFCDGKKPYNLLDENLKYLFESVLKD